MTNVIIIETNFEYGRLEETIALCEAADAAVKGVVEQAVKTITPATYIGKGKVEEVKILAENENADMIVFDGELTPSQTINISDVVGKTVITRTNLILDIFARRARSSEGKILVELAQLKYIYPRLKGRGDSLSRLGGGIGTRGPGETKLETDRRHIKERIRFLENHLETIEKRRNIYENRRKKNGVFSVVLVGYTNTGKSTLLNKLCKSDVMTMDALFATLDPTSRKGYIDGTIVNFTDTVGLIKELPPELEKAFVSTLEQAKSADVILNVASANDDFISQFAVTDEYLNKIGATENRIRVVNKCDLTGPLDNPRFTCISAKNGFGLEKLKQLILLFYTRKTKLCLS